MFVQKLKLNFPQIFVGLTVLGFLAYKIPGIVIRFSDSSAYIYMAQRVVGGAWPYRDFFLADPPVMVLLLAALRPLFGNHFWLYSLLPLLLESATAYFMYAFLRHFKNPLAALAPAIYLMTFTVVATSDYLTGVQFVMFFSSVAVHFWFKRWPYLSGIFWALAILTKLYAVPMFLGFAVYILWQREYRQFLRLVAAGVAASAVVIGPFLFLAAPEVFRNLIYHQLHRPPGLAKGHVLSYFWRREWLLLLLAFCGAFTRRWWLVVILPLVFTAAFLLWFQDIYYMYLDLTIFWLVMLAVSLFAWLWAYSDIRWVAKIFLVGYFVFALISIAFYEKNTKVVQRFLNAQEIADYVKDQKPVLPIYGSHEVAPVVALLSDRSLFSNHIDTNSQAFGTGAQDLKAISEAAARNGIYLLTRLVDRPDLGVLPSGFEGYFDRETFDRSCTRLKDFPSTGGEIDNYVTVFRCQESRD